MKHLGRDSYEWDKLVPKTPGAVPRIHPQGLHCPHCLCFLAAREFEDNLVLRHSSFNGLGYSHICKYRGLILERYASVGSLSLSPIPEGGLSISPIETYMPKPTFLTKIFSKFKFRRNQKVIDRHAE